MLARTGLDDHPDAIVMDDPDVAVVDRVWARLVALLLLAAVALAVAWSMDRVAISVDGEVQSVALLHGTVADALAGADVTLGAADVVTPGPATPLADGMSVRVERAGEYTVIVDGQRARVRTVADHLDDVLVAAGIGDTTQLVVQPSSTQVVDGMVVRVTTPHRVTVLVDDQRLAVELIPSTVGAALRAAGVDLGDGDRVEPGVDTPTAAGQVITVTRRDSRTEQVEVPIEFETDWVPTPERLVGDDVEVVAGVDGVEVETWEIVVVDGEEARRELVDTAVTAEPVERVVEVGTGSPAPEPEPEPESTWTPEPTTAPEPATAPEPSSTPEPTSEPDPEPRRTREPEPEPTPEPTPEPRPEPTTPPAPSNSVWDDLAQCESHGQWDLNVGLYDGGLQFHPDTWRSWKKSSYPDYAWQATRSQQIEAAERLQEALGWGQWPHCARELGLL